MVKIGKLIAALSKASIDKLAGGPPNEKVLEERKNWFFLSRHKWGVCFPLILTLFFLGNYLIGYPLNPTPVYDNLSVIQGKVIGEYRASPEFLVQLTNGQNIKMEWPGDYYILGTPKTNGPYIRHDKILNGCQATIKYAPMRFVLSEHLRIWELECQSKGLFVTHGEIVKSFEKNSESYKFIFSWSLVFIYILSFFFFLREKRGNNS